MRRDDAGGDVRVSALRRGKASGRFDEARQAEQRTCLSRRESLENSESIDARPPPSRRRVDFRSNVHPATSCHHYFHSSARLASRRRSRYKSVSAAKMGLVKSDDFIEKFAKTNFPEYTTEEKAKLRRTYSPAQVAALEAGEAAIDPEDLARGGRIRVDPHRMSYIDDFSTIQPVIDKRPRTKPPPDPNARFSNDLSSFDFLATWTDSNNPEMSLSNFAPFMFQDVPIDEWPIEIWDHGTRSKMDELLKDQCLSMELLENAPRGEEGKPSLRMTVNMMELSPGLNYKFWNESSIMTDGTEKGSQSALAPALPNKVPGVAGYYAKAVDPEDNGEDPQGVFQDLKKQTGLTLADIKAMTTKILVHRFVSNQTRLGKIRSSSVMVVAGNQNGWMGLGMAKSTEPSTAVAKAKMLAIRNLRPVPRYENRTIYGNVEAKVGATIVQLYTRPPGFGLRVSHRIFEMCRAAGIHDLAAKMPRARNPMNSVKATFQALMSQPNPEEIAIGRGKKLVDVRKVYYGGAVY
ncbi:hypothetical protein P8C59_006218 [Phyllachora maydis]|uniref:Small ribosomal subunit protein uS5m n=1 Tax=Phyllachora maydis TaxID=1825666 RepID=A0AAD9I5W1_9PEZI|nr:hypothetical protein P8C59_006218 [Phyllachora maydis]